MTKLLRALPLLLACVAALLSTVQLSTVQAQGVTREVWVVPIETQITPATAQFVQSRIEQANEVQPLALVFYLNTPGGSLNAMIDIADTILQRVQVPTITVVENAFSAGALISMSAEQMAMLPGSSIGAATAINGITGERASEKINSAVREKFRSVAEARGRNADVAEGMVSERIEVPGLSTNEELITLSAAQAVEYDIADVQARNLADALEQFGYGGAEVVRLEPNFAERIGTALGNPLIAAALLVIGIGGILIEAFTPGFGFPGALGLLALVIFGAGTFVATPAGGLDLILILGGVLLLLVEAFVIPGFGVAGILGLAVIVVAIVRIFPDPTQLASVLGYTAIFGAVLVVGFFWLLPNSRFTRIFALSTRLSNAPGDSPESARLVASQDYLRGSQGVATSDLRPAGVARFGTERVDVVTEGDYISTGTPIEVTRVEGSRVVVRTIASQEEGA